MIGRQRGRNLNGDHAEAYGEANHALAGQLELLTSLGRVRNLA